MTAYDGITEAPSTAWAPYDERSDRPVAGAQKAQIPQAAYRAIPVVDLIVDGAKVAEDPYTVHVCHVPPRWAPCQPYACGQDAGTRCALCGHQYCPDHFESHTQIVDVPRVQWSDFAKFLQERLHAKASGESQYIGRYSKQTAE